ncbi:hypothetical protein [Caballeronia insecticola]|nr:hypothetical protein [Caballeronia insecticola]
MNVDVPSDMVEIASRSPVYRLLGVADKVYGKHLNHVWKGLAGMPWLDEPGLPVFAKYLPQTSQLDIELACGLASQVLRLPVPRPALVIADLEDLPSHPANLKHGPVMLFGSVFQPPDPFFAQRIEDNPLAVDYIWQKVCDDEVAPKGAAWDELVANPDRHAQNLLFDGGKWWLFDHNLALQPLAKLYTKVEQQSAQQAIVEHVARVNQLLAELCRRNRNSRETLTEAEQMTRHSKRLALLAHAMRRWEVDVKIAPTITMAALIVDLIALRLQPLALYLAKRLEIPSQDSLWSSP